MSNSYISIVVTTRNDNYGENMLQRLNMFIKSLDYYQSLYPNLFELVIVEWNPPESSASLSTIIPDCKNLPIRIITVPPEHHNKLGIKRSLAEWPAKNVGLRRAKSPFVLIANPDILLSPALVESLAARNLSDDVIYRCDRYDFNGDGINDIIPSDYTNWAMSKIFKLHGMYGAQSISVDIDLALSNNKLPVSRFDENTIHTNGAGDFMLIAKDSAIRVGGFYEGLKCQGHGDSVSMYRFIKANIAHGIFEFPCFTLHHDHDRNILPPPYDIEAVLNTAHDTNNSDWGLDSVLLLERNNGL
jgi:hypothetical protein